MEQITSKEDLIQDIETNTNKRFTIVICLVGRICSGKNTFSSLLYERGIRIVEGGDIKIEELLAHLIELRKQGLKTDDIIEQMKVKIGVIYEELADSFEERCKKILDEWKIPTVINRIYTQEEVCFMQKRNYFHQIYIDCPLLIRYKRFQSKYSKYAQDFDLELFCILDDCMVQSYINKQSNSTQKVNYGFNLRHIIKHVKATILNDGTVDDLEEQILNNHRKIFRPFKPDYDMYFMKLAVEVKKRSNCSKRSVGAILASKDNRILSTGYNGTPYLLNDCYNDGCARCNSNIGQGKNLMDCRCIHAEDNCILEVGVRTCNDQGGTIYTTLFPCKWCMKVIVQSGIRRVVYMEDFDSNQSMSIIESFQKRNPDVKFEIKKQTLEDYVF